MNNQMKKGFSSDYIQAKKQNAIYTSLLKNAQLTGTTVNPVKNNGFFYNNTLNVIVPNDCDSNGCSGGILSNARSYQLRLDFKRGKYYNNYVCNCKSNVIKDVGESCIITPMDGKSVVECSCNPCAFN